MGIIRKFDELREYLSPEGLEIYAEVKRHIIGYEHSLTAAELVTALNKRTDQIDYTHIGIHLELLHKAVIEFYVPFFGQDHTFKTDAKLFFHYMRTYLEVGLIDQARQLMNEYPRIFNSEGKEVCAAQTSSCKSEFEGVPCEYRYREGEMVCPVCKTPRRLCRQRPMANGRCRHHGGRAAATTFAGRSGLYASATQDNRILEAIQYSLQGDDDISMRGEIAILGGRIAQLMNEASDFSIVEQAELYQDKIEKAEKSLEKDKSLEAIRHLRDALMIAGTVRNNSDQWKEIGNMINILRVVVSEERTQRSEKKKVLTADQVIMYRKQTMDIVTNALAEVAAAVANHLTHQLQNESLDDLLADSDFTSGKLIERRLRYQLTEAFRRDSQEQRTRAMRLTAGKK